jgi:hypothetical protein
MLLEEVDLNVKEPEKETPLTPTNTTTHKALSKGGVLV